MTSPKSGQRSLLAIILWKQIVTQDRATRRLCDGEMHVGELIRGFQGLLLAFVDAGVPGTAAVRAHQRGRQQGPPPEAA
jgi:hypothetical protein